ncbi:peptide chain release factor 1 [Lusitaniella coriacea LEGE 07157]|uniref:Peptide chain release factor 1 n=1 Tax=Lusitaniella coriacea LEGE 07157 TaxID=945747 RepID=A0A8J7B8E8_9CYAN|nr:peptide chain release factor 1 [Lusitaniella coriacea]MBE9115405.1 peptide chain release factor 1 [Lusitaniella coriacea LEGE 07157]
MNDPIRRFKQQPWLPLFRVAGLTTLVVILIEVIVLFSVTHSAFVAEIFSILRSGSLSIILSFVAAMGVGTLGVYLCERFSPQVYLNTASLWALILCLLCGMGLKSAIKFPSILVGFSMVTLIGIMIGVFWRNRAYWR